MISRSPPAARNRVITSPTPARASTAISAPHAHPGLFTNLESFPGLVFVMLGSLDRPELIQPKLEMFTKRRMKWVKPLDLPQFEAMPH